MFSPVKLLPASQFTGDALDSIIQKISGASFAKTAAEKAAEEAAAYMTKPQIEKKIREARKLMEQAAKELDFIKAAQLRDEIKMLQAKL